MSTSSKTEIPTIDPPPRDPPLDPPEKEDTDTEEDAGARLLRKNPTMTATGKANLIITLKRQIKSISKRLDKQLTVLTPLLQSTSVSTINNETLNLDRIYNEITDTHARLCEILNGDEDRSEYDAAVLVLETIDTQYFDMKTHLGKWQLEWDARVSKKGDGSASSSSSRASSKGSGRSGKSAKSKESTTSSKRSNISNKSLKLRAKIAGLRAEAEAIKKTSEAELNVLLLRKEQEIAKMEAMEKVYTGSCCSRIAKETTHIAKEELQDEVKLKPDCDTKNEAGAMKRSIKPPKEEAFSSGENKEKEPPHKKPKSTPELQDAVVEMMKLQAAPKPHLDVFAGDPLEYPYFRACFTEVVETVVSDQRGRLTRLIKYTSGDAKDLIKHMVHVNDDCYDKAIRMLDKEYGNPHLIHQSYIKELRQWEPIKANDTPAYKKFYRFLLKCHTYKDTYQLRELDSTEMIRGIICKVHQSQQERWNRKAISIRNNQSREADFSDLMDFIEHEVTLMSDPSYSKDALANANKTVKSNFTSTTLPEPSNCPLCSSHHDIESCDEYLNMHIDDRHKTIFQKKLCFGCFDPVSQDHNGKSCQKKRKCVVCKEEHPTTLHGGKSLTAFSSSVQCSVISMCVVQVELWHDDSPDNVVKVYALLDECSTGSFGTDEVLDRLAIPNAEYTSVDVTTLNGSQQQPARKVEKSKLIVRATPSHSSTYNDAPIKLPTTYSRPFLAVDPQEIPTPSRIRHWAHLQDLVNKIPDYDPTVPIGLMLGGDCPKANEVVEVIPSANSGPYGKRTRLGWCIIGPIASCSASKFIHSNYTNLRGKIPVKDVTTGNVACHSFFHQDSSSHDPYTGMLNHMYQQDFNDANGEKEGLSVEDRRFLQIMKDGVVKVDGHYQLPLPLRNKDVNLPNNRFQAVSRLSSLKRKMLADSEYSAAYNNVIQSMLSSGYARKARVREGEQGEVWYVPHFGVSNAKKGKLRVVFDFSAKFKGRCLNSELIPGPNLANLMIGVIIRFRKEPIAYMADIEAMYHQVFVPEEQRSFLRFLFWPDGNLQAEPIDLEMCVHPFGAVSSGSCANYALLQTADDNENKYGSEAANTLRREFYVDDNLKSVESVAKAKNLFGATRNMCETGGFKLTKFVSNSPELTASIPSECRAPLLIDLSMTKYPLPVDQRALGVFWCVENDILQIRIVFQSKPLTRRGVLATIGSVFDPTGIAGPFLLRGRKVLQAITKLKGDWDDELPPSLRSEWEKWREEIPQLEKIKVNRCYKPPWFNTVAASLHSFSDASEYGYGMVTYLRQVSSEDKVCVSFVMAKSRVVPIKMKPSIPRLELAAAEVSAKTTALVKDELDMALNTISYWVDSTIVLGYIQNETKRARTFVSNRVQTILRLTKKDSWNHIDTKLNPADYASRGLVVSENGKVNIWLNGPQMLWENEDPSGKPPLQVQIPDDDPEIHTTISCNVTSVSDTTILSFLENLANWTEMKEVVATAAMFLEILRKQREKPDLTVSDVATAEKTIIRIIQNKHYSKERRRLESGSRIHKSSTIIKLDPFLDEEQLLRVGGRLRKGKLLNCEKHPVILPKKEPIITSIIHHYHEEIAHLGRTSTLGELRSRGYWVINGGAQVRSLVDHCRQCKELRGKPESQKMADLPEERVLCAEPPFTCCGADMFGPFIVKEGRKELKRYGIIFTCYSCRGVHIETTTSMDTDSFILALRRFLSRRGPVRSIRSDNGGNFVGVEEEMKKSLLEMDHDRIRAFLLTHECDWIEWQKNPPEASHMGGVWERQIRTVRNVLSSLLKEHASRLDDEAFRTLLCEVEAIVNSRPLTVDNLSDENESPLTPNHLLTMKSKVLLPPPGVFQRADVYCRKRWRAVQHLANDFWNRFRKEYLQVTQSRQKWNSVRRNVAVGDIVLVVEKDLPRNRWTKGRVVKVFPGDDSLVRHVDVKMAGSRSILKRPITKLIILIRADDQ